MSEATIFRSRHLVPVLVLSGLVSSAPATAQSRPTTRVMSAASVQSPDACPTGPIPNLGLSETCGGSSCSVTLSWGAPPGATGAEVYEVRQDLGPGYCGPFTSSIVGTTTGRTFTMSSLPREKGIAYVIGVQGCGSIFSDRKIYSDTFTSPPGAPVLTATAQGTNQVRLTFSRPDERSFSVKSLTRRVGAGSPVAVSGFDAGLQNYCPAGSSKVLVDTVPGSGTYTYEATCWGNTPNGFQDVSAVPVTVTVNGSSGPCGAASNKLTLRGRYELSVRYRNQYTNPATEGCGTAASLVSATGSDQTGYFWFFSPDGLSVILKAFTPSETPNQKTWLAFSALETVEYWVDVRDVQTGQTRTFYSPPGVQTSAFSSDVFGGASVEPVDGGGPIPEILLQSTVGDLIPLVPRSAETSSQGGARAPVSTPAVLVERKALAPAAGCTADASTLCLKNGRYRLTSHFRNQYTTPATEGTGGAVKLTDQTGFFWYIFGKQNIGAVLKMFTPQETPNSRTWLAYGGLETIEYWIRVEDTTTGDAVEFRNEPGVQAAFFSSDVFRPEPTWVITSTAGPGGFISPAGAVTVREGSDATFQISANGGYLIDDVKVNGASVGAVGTYTFTNVRSNQTIAATFKEKPGVFYTLSAKTTTSGGTISPSGDVKVKEGSNQTFLIAASQGFSIRDVAVDGQSIGAQGAYTFEKVQAEGHRIEAAFQAIPKPKYVIAASAGNGGTVTPGGNVSVEEGSNAGFAIAASSGFKIADVKVDGVSVGALSTYTFGSVTANHSLAASFSQVPAPPPGSYKITVTVTGPGRAEPSGDVFVENGKSQTILFIPNAGGTVKNVVVDGVNLGPAVSYSFVGVNATHTLSVSF